jgi:hypothetical protein
MVTIPLPYETIDDSLITDDGNYTVILFEATDADMGLRWDTVGGRVDWHRPSKAID